MRYEPSDEPRIHMIFDGNTSVEFKRKVNENYVNKPLFKNGVTIGPAGCLPCCMYMNPDTYKDIMSPAGVKNLMNYMNKV